MHRRALLKAAAMSPIAFGSAGVTQAAAVGAGNSINEMLLPYLAQHDLPALLAAVVLNGSVLASGAVGTRRAGTDIPVTLDDRLHIGSDTKAMTALAAAMLIEEGKLRWDSTVAELFPELVGTMNPGLRGVTLTELLSHTSGMAPDNEALDTLIAQSCAQGDLNLDELRAGW